MTLDAVGAITLFVDDVNRSQSWYQRVFERPPVYKDDASAVFRFDNVLVNLLARREADSLIRPALVASRDAGSHFQLTVWVDDTDAVCADLRSRGIELVNGPMDPEWGQRTACFADPDGHIWEIAQKLHRPGGE